MDKNPLINIRPKTLKKGGNYKFLSNILRQSFRLPLKSVNEKIYNLIRDSFKKNFFSQEKNFKLLPINKLII